MRCGRIERRLKLAEIAERATHCFESHSLGSGMTNAPPFTRVLSRKHNVRSFALELIILTGKFKVIYH